MFIAVDLKVIEGLAGAVARAAGVSEDVVLSGLVRLWHRCWADEIDTMTPVEVFGSFALKGRSSDALERALESFGFLDRQVSVFRIRGAARYLRLKESRRRGAAVTNAARARSKSDALERSGATHNDALPPSHRVTESPRQDKRSVAHDAARPLELAPTSSPKTPKQKPEKATDPRHAPLVKALCDVFARETGAKYPFAPIDARAVTQLLSAGIEPTITAAWSKALRSSAYPLVRTLPELAKHLAHFVGSTGAQQHLTGIEGSGPLTATEGEI